MKHAPIPSGARGLRRDAAAAYLGVSPGTFDEWVREGRLPHAAVRVRKVVLWDRQQLDAAFDALVDAGGNDNSWGDYGGEGAAAAR